MWRKSPFTELDSSWGGNNMHSEGTSSVVQDGAKYSYRTIKTHAVFAVTIGDMALRPVYITPHETSSNNCIPSFNQLKIRKICTYETINSPVWPLVYAPIFWIILKVTSFISTFCFSSPVVLLPTCDFTYLLVELEWGRTDYGSSRCLYLFSCSVLTEAGLDERICIFCFSFKFHHQEKKSCRCGLLATPTQKMQDCINKKVCARRANWCNNSSCKEDFPPVRSGYWICTLSRY